LKTYTISIDIKVRSKAHEQGKIYQVEGHYKINWSRLQSAARNAVARLLNLLDRVYCRWQSGREDPPTWPPHSLFCEQRCCQKSFTSYHRFLKKELAWNKEGHLI
jgi:hypothetical protein